MTNTRTLLCLLTVLLPCVVKSGQAQQSSSADLNAPMPKCGPQMDGQVFCKFGAIYECQYVDVNSLERRTGWLWKTDILQSCDEPRPATLAQPDGLPPGFTYAPQLGNNQANQYDPSNRQGYTDVPPSQSGGQQGGTPFFGPNGSTLQYRGMHQN